jgi:DNA polymerase II large subunit
MTKEYFQQIEQQINKEFNLAAKARKKGADASDQPEIYIAKDVAEKVEGLIGVEGIAETIRKLSKELKTEEEIALQLSKEVANKYEDKEKAADLAIRAGLAFLTQGAVAAPLEGIAKVKIGKNPDDTKYLSVYYAGPIRAAGGTAEALSVVVADYVRVILGLDKYKPTLREIGRYYEEIQWYHRHTHLQYYPSEEEVETIVRNMPICLDGEPTEEYEVANYRDLGRVETNRVRGGMCLVLAEGLAQKAPKLLKKIRPVIKEYKLEWGWLNDLMSKKAARDDPSIREEQKEGIFPGFEWVYGFAEEGEGISEILELAEEEGKWDWMEEPDEDEQVKGGTKKYLQEIPAGRPVFSYPGAKGGFVLRYGRTRASGYAAVAINPATMYLVDNFIAIGTQIRLELPGKAGIVTPCDTINGPTLRLKDGEVLQVNDVEHAKNIKHEVDAILSLGDLLISAGEFIENNHTLMPSSWCEEWWAHLVKEALKEGHIDNIERFINPPFQKPDFETAIRISKELGVPLHPQYTFFWHDLTLKELKHLVKKLEQAKRTEEGIVLENELHIKTILETLGIFHKTEKNAIKITEHAAPLMVSLGMIDGTATEKLEKTTLHTKKPVKIVSELSHLKIIPKAPTRVGARMGRPEKAKPRKMVPPPHVLFPTGATRGRIRDLTKIAATSGTSMPIISKYSCSSCNKATFLPKCPDCGERTQLIRTCSNCNITIQSDRCPKCGSEAKTAESREIDFKSLIETASSNLGIKAPEHIKGVLSMTSKSRIPEPIEKGLLRAQEDIYVFKDGTIRFDSTDAPLTHFKPKEIGSSVEKLKELGYSTDALGNPIENEDQVIAIKPQDIVISDYGEAPASQYLLNAAKFVDNLLEKYYKLKPHYKATKKQDLIGKLVIALAPHTSTGIVGRIIGFTNARVGYANPCFHAAKRRDCDGDEDAVMLLLDALLNFSKSFLPDKRGGRMDAPLVITTTLSLLEIDDEVYDLDIVNNYPLEFYEQTLKGADPSEVQLKTVKDMIKEEKPFEGWSYTHETSDINLGPHLNTYSEGEMLEKLKRQMELAEKIRAVDEKDVAEKIISSHFIPDIRGNLRTFSKQKVRCTKCNAKYRRAPLTGTCTRCGGNLTLTVHKGTIVKYLQVSKELAEKYKITPYLSQQISLFDKIIFSIFGRDEQAKLGEFST